MATEVNADDASAKATAPAVGSGEGQGDHQVGPLRHDPREVEELLPADALGCCDELATTVPPARRTAAGSRLSNRGIARRCGYLHHGVISFEEYRHLPKILFGVRDASTESPWGVLSKSFGQPVLLGLQEIR
jgi:hypothetical protein